MEKVIRVETARVSEGYTNASDEMVKAARILEKTAAKLTLAGVGAIPASHLCAKSVEEYLHLQHLRAQKVKKITDALTKPTN